MKKSTKFMLAALIALSSTAYSKELVNKDGYVMDVFGLVNVGVKSQTFKIDDYSNTLTGIKEDDAWFQLGLKKHMGNMEAGGHLRYGAGYEANKDRVGGDMFIKYNFNENFYAEYQKSDFKYVDTKIYTSVDHQTSIKANTIGKNLGTGQQLELTPEGFVTSNVLSSIEVDFGVAFLGVGAKEVLEQYDTGGFTPEGAIWQSHMAYKKNNIDHDITPSVLNFGYKGDSTTIDTSVVYQNRTTKDASDDVNATNTGFTIKGSYALGEKTKIGAGFQTGKGVSDYDTDSNDVTTTISSQNAWYKTNVAGFDIFAEVGHSDYECDTDAKFNYASLDTSVEAIIEHQLGAKRSLNGAYAKISKFMPGIGIPELGVKLAQSKFDKVHGFEYSNSQINTLFELKPAITIPSKKTPMLMYKASATFGTYKSENAGGTKDKTMDASQTTISTGITYIF